MKNRLSVLLAILGFTAIAGAHDHNAGTPLDAALDDYVKIQAALAADSLKDVPEAAASLAATARRQFSG